MGRMIMAVVAVALCTLERADSPCLLKRVGRIFKPETVSPARITLAIYSSLYYLQFITPLGPEDIERERAVPVQYSLFWGRVKRA